MSHKQIYYSDKYDDEEFEYRTLPHPTLREPPPPPPWRLTSYFRHVMLPKDIAKLVPKTHLMSESEWRNLGVQQSQGWVHYMIHEPEPHILLFRRPLPKKPKK
ncbi:cyclin-dependent kinases regulatory subunit 1 isoform X1 [Hylobates moloch]|uniref:cyclin-dependent kinases regulatory subunit 1 isoform X1 n=1 Tax=Hylobates moloch TaxID=81572 RepID=UPI002676E348|nr:cyclin-dependent kinases regulatory subunit 1 isoform X1 [Hylobates moloch]